MQKSKAIEIMVEQEKVQSTFNNIRCNQGRKGNSSLLCLEIPGKTYIVNEGIEREIPSKVLTDQKNIQDEIIQWNISHFSRVLKTPQEISGFLFEALDEHGTTNFRKWSWMED